MTDNTLVLEKRESHNSRRVCLVNPVSDNSNTTTSFLIPETTVLLLSPFTSYSTTEKEKKVNDRLRPSLRTNDKSTRSTKTVHFNVPLTEVVYFHYQDDIEDEESILEDTFLDFYAKSFHIDLFDTHCFQYEMLIQDTLNTPRQNVVYLEQLRWENTDSIIYGSVIVYNLAFEKYVVVRLTFDDWVSYIDINATYKESTDSSYDRFLFEIVPFEHIPPNKDLINSTCRLAIQYRVNGHCYWDNNNNSNYTVRWWIQPVSNTGFFL